MTVHYPIAVLATGDMPSTQKLGDMFDVHKLETAQPAQAIAGSVRALIAAGPRKIDDEMLARFPRLELIANFGVGYDRVDIVSASRRGIVVTNTPDVLTEEVADFALGLLIATVRRIPQADAFVRNGSWAAGNPFPLSASLRGRHIGIVGMGRIGSSIARRCAAMGLQVSYSSRGMRADLPYRYYDKLYGLAEVVDVLIVAVPGGEETARLVDASVMAALGPRGILINIARGSVVDEAALIAALRSDELMAAGLDVFPDEPRVAQDLIDLPNTLLTPHIGSATKKTREAMGDLVLANIESWFTGDGALTPVNQPSTNTRKSDRSRGTR